MGGLLTFLVRLSATDPTGESGAHPSHRLGALLMGGLGAHLTCGSVIRPTSSLTTRLLGGLWGGLGV